jgi:hypothetical protein
MFHLMGEMVEVLPIGWLSENLKLIWKIWSTTWWKDIVEVTPQHM